MERNCSEERQKGNVRVCSPHIIEIVLQIKVLMRDEVRSRKANSYMRTQFVLPT